MLEGRWGLIPDMSGVRSLAELVGIDTAKLLTMTTRKVSGKEALDRERSEQLVLLFAANTRAAREAAFAKVAPRFGPRTRR